MTDRLPIIYRSDPQVSEFAAHWQDTFPAKNYLEVLGNSVGITLDASQRSVVDGFQETYRHAFMRHMLSKVTAHSQIFAAFSKAEPHRPGATAQVKERRLLLWQDKGDRVSDLYHAADQVQLLLFNLGYSRYPASIPRPSRTSITESSQSASLLRRVQFALFGKMAPIGASAGLESAYTRAQEQKETVREEITSAPSSDKGRWDFTIPYLREIGTALGLLTPEALVELSEKDSVSKGLRQNAIDETYQRFRTAEIALCQATATILSGELRDDEELVWMLQQGYVVESLESIANHIDGLQVGRHPEDLQPRERAQLAEMEWVLHLSLYAALYHGARQRIEDHVCDFVRDMAIRNVPGSVVDVSMHRDYGDTLPNQKVKPLSSTNELSNVANYLQHLRIPMFWQDQDDGSVHVSVWPEITPTQRNPGDPRVEYNCATFTPLRGNTPITTPLDALAIQAGADSGSFDPQDKSCNADLKPAYERALRPLLERRQSSEDATRVSASSSRQRRLP